MSTHGPLTCTCPYPAVIDTDNASGHADDCPVEIAALEQRRRHERDERRRDAEHERGIVPRLFRKWDLRMVKR